MTSELVAQTSDIDYVKQGFISDHDIIKVATDQIPGALVNRAELLRRKGTPEVYYRALRQLSDTVSNVLAGQPVEIQQLSSPRFVDELVDKALPFGIYTDDTTLVLRNYLEAAYRVMYGIPKD